MTKDREFDYSFIPFNQPGNYEPGDQGYNQVLFINDSSVIVKVNGRKVAPGGGTFGFGGNRNEVCKRPINIDFPVAGGTRDFWIVKIYYVD